MQISPLFRFSLGLAVLIATVPGCRQSDPVAKAPNILIAISDDQSHFHAGPYGLQPVRTPVLDRLAGEGILFMNAFSASPMCTVGRASLLTGRYPWQNGEAGQHYSHFPEELICFTDILEESGYTVGFTGGGWKPGDWKVTGRPRNPAGYEYNEIRLKEKPATGLSTYDYAENFKAFLDRKDPDQPFCFWYGALEPHSPYEKGSGIRAGFDPDKLKLPLPYRDTSLAAKSRVLDIFCEIEWFDSHLGRMVWTLQERGEYDNTIIVVTSDNGSPMPRAKCNLYELGTHVPLVILWPGRTEPGRVVDELVSQIDLAPTFLEAAGAVDPGTMTGESILDIILARGRENQAPGREFVLAAQEKAGHQKHEHLGYPMRSIRTREYLYIRNFKPGRWPGDDLGAEEKAALDPRYAKRPAEELYRPGDDLACMNNLAGEPEYIEVLEDLRKKLDSILISQHDPRALGYGDIYESFPRYGSFNPELEGFKKQGEYNPDYLTAIPENIFVSELYHAALENKQKHEKENQ